MSDAMDSGESESVVYGCVTRHLCSGLIVCHVPRRPRRLYLPIQVLDPLSGAPGGYCAIRVSRVLQQSDASFFEDRLQEVRASGVVLLIFVDAIVADLELTSERCIDVESFLDVCPVQLPYGTAHFTEGVLLARSELAHVLQSEQTLANAV